MSRQFFVTALLVALISIANGCRNPRCWAPCNNGCIGFAPSSTLPAPPTGSLQIPSISQGQPYYTPGSGVPTTAQQPSYLVNPNSQAPTPANGAPSLAPQQGWRPVGSLDGAMNTNGGGEMQSILQRASGASTAQPTFAPQRAPDNFAQNTAGPSSLRTASTSNAGLSFKDSINYRTTQIDERFDDTRLPATDAGSVRAPAGVNQVAQGTGFSPAYPIYGTVIPGQPTYPAQPQYGYPPNQPYASSQGFPRVQTTQPATIAGSVEYGMPGVIYNTYPASYSAPGTAVVAQSTATYDPQNSSNYQSGWRDRELTSRR